MSLRNAGADALKVNSSRLMQAHAGSYRLVQARARSRRHMQAHAGTCRPMQARVTHPSNQRFHHKHTQRLQTSFGLHQICLAVVSWITYVHPGPQLWHDVVAPRFRQVSEIRQKRKRKGKQAGRPDPGRAEQEHKSVTRADEDDDDDDVAGQQYLEKGHHSIPCHGTNENKKKCLPQSGGHAERCRAAVSRDRPPRDPVPRDEGE